MQILYFHQYFSTPQGKGGTRAFEMSKALAEAGHDVHVVCGSSPKHDTGLEGDFHKNVRSGYVGNVKVTQIQLNYNNKDGKVTRVYKFIRFALFGIKIALHESYDVIFTSSTPLTVSLPGIVAKVLRRKQFIFEVRDLWPELPKAMGAIKNPILLMGMSALEWASYRAANACIGLSPGIVEGIKKRSGANKPVALIPNGCDLQLFSKEHLERASIPGVADTDFVAIFTGAHGMANGLNAVLDTAKRLKEQHHNTIKLVFIGDGSEKAQLQARCEQEQLTNCLFLDPVKKDILGSFMKRADVALMILKNVPAFYYGTSPNKFFDYLSIGIPILNNYPGWLADLINEHHLGAVVPPNDPQAMADALVALSQSDQLETHASNARELAESTFDRQLLANKFVEFFEQQVKIDTTSIKPKSL